jgi:UDP-glucose 4-epimerase
VREAVLVTGGAGYIGSHTVRRLLEDGRRVVVFDDLSTGHVEATQLFSHVYGPDRFLFVQGSLLDIPAVEALFSVHDIAGVIDFAARSIVPESQSDPRLYFEQNVLAFRNLMAACPGVPLVKSSTASTYGDPPSSSIPLSEDYQARAADDSRYAQSQLDGAAAPLQTLLDWYAHEAGGVGVDDVALRIPTSVYGVTKAMDELMLRGRLAAGRGPYTALRYFNAAGADESRLIGEDHSPETHLIPIVLQVALGRRDALTMYGTGYDTPDGTAVRDFVSVSDLAAAHILSLDGLLAGGESATYNLGSGEGHTVGEIVEAAREVSGHDIPTLNGQPRAGDPERLVADSSKIRAALGWEATTSIEEVVASAWHWHRLHPDGYRTPQEERYNPFWGRWVNIAAHRRSRPWSGETQALEAATIPSHDPDCYLCPGNTRISGETNPDYTSVWSFANDFPTLTETAYEVAHEDGPYRARTSKGLCEVVNYSPDHSQRLSSLDADGVVALVDAWAGVYARVGARDDIAYPLIFENRGTIMGNSQPHPHGQVYAYSTIPDLIVGPQIEEFAGYRARKDGACFVCDAARSELADGRRVLTSDKHMTAFVPYAAQYPYDIIVTPTRHVASLLDLDRDERRSLAHALLHALTGLDGLFDAPYHYSLALVQAPTDGVDYGYHMQAHITSLLRGPGLRKHVVGADIFGRLVNPSDPDVAAEEIRWAARRQTLGSS